MATWLGVMLALSIANEDAKKTYIIITILISIWIIFMYVSNLVSSNFPINFDNWTISFENHL